jgi:cysteinyl-tRNA synthetase
LAGDRDAILAVLASFDAVFDVIEDRDAEPTRRALEWAEQAGRLADVAPELLAAQSLTDEAIDALVAERTQAKKQRNFARADQIRNELRRKGRRDRRLQRRRALEAEVHLWRSPPSGCAQEKLCSVSW